jgi:hypothetical protein
MVPEDVERMTTSKSPAELPRPASALSTSQTSWSTDTGSVRSVEASCFSA